MGINFKIKSECSRSSSRRQKTLHPTTWQNIKLFRRVLLMPKRELEKVNLSWRRKEESPEGLLLSETSNNKEFLECYQQDSQLIILDLKLSTVLIYMQMCQKD